MSPKVFYIQYTNPAAYPPLEHSSRILADDGWHVRFFGRRSSEQDSLSFPEHRNIQQQWMEFCAPGWRQKLDYLLYSLWVFRSVLTCRPRWIYCSDLLSCPLALLLSWLPGMEILYHEHDSPAPASGRETWLVRVALRARAALASRVRLCILPNHSRIDRFRAQIPSAKTVLCVWNCPMRCELGPPRPRPEGDFWLVYQGSLVPSRLSTLVLDAMAELPPRVKLRVVGYETVGCPDFLKNFTGTAARLGVQERLEIAGAMPHGEMLESSYKCHVGLSLMPTHSDDPNQQTMTGASNKPFDYLACGLAVLVSDLPDWKEMFVENGLGLCCVPEDAASIARALRWFYEHPAETLSMGERGRARIAAEWNYERQFRPVLATMNQYRD